ncbi:MAG: NAD-dependent epimerase/dehydratase family protein [Anaerolineaceae bacterium]|nr:NAD-dependent epimerase/dehydratase family protein [Anaerolineaceae bacterium]
MGKVLVTGGAGFIGSAIVRALLERGSEVRVLDNFSTGRRENLADILGDIELIEDSICRPEACLRAAQGRQVVFHQAADVSVPRSMIDPGNTHRTNVDGLYNCLVAARERGVRRFVFASSSAVYGPRAALPAGEGALPDPVSPYGTSKAIGELYCAMFARCFGVETVCLRYFNVFGPRQDPASQYAAAIPAFVSRMLHGERPTVFGTGRQSRDFTFVENVVRANLLAAEAPLDGPLVVNIGCGTGTSLNEIIGLLNRLLGTDLQPLYEKSRPGDIMHSWADIAAAEKLIGYRPGVDFAEGLRKAIDWYRDNL